MVVKLYVSGISGNKEVKKKQQRVQMILDSKSISYEAIDITEPGKEKEKEFMQQRGKVRENLGKHPLPPQIFNEDDYCGDYDDFDMANEVDELEAFLHVPVPSKLSRSDSTSKVNGSREENGESERNGANTTEVNGDVELTSIIPETDETSPTSKTDAAPDKGEDGANGDVAVPPIDVNNLSDEPQETELITEDSPTVKEENNDAVEDVKEETERPNEEKEEEEEEEAHEDVEVDIPTKEIKIEDSFIEGKQIADKDGDKLHDEGVMCTSNISQTTENKLKEASSNVDNGSVDANSNIVSSTRDRDTKEIIESSLSRESKDSAQESPVAQIASVSKDITKIDDSSSRTGSNLELFEEKGEDTKEDNEQHKELDKAGVRQSSPENIIGVTPSRKSELSSEELNVTFQGSKDQAIKTRENQGKSIEELSSKHITCAESQNESANLVSDGIVDQQTKDKVLLSQAQQDKDISKQVSQESLPIATEPETEIAASLKKSTSEEQDTAAAQNLREEVEKESSTTSSAVASQDTVLVGTKDKFVDEDFLKRCQVISSDSLAPKDILGVDPTTDFNESTKSKGLVEKMPGPTSATAPTGKADSRNIKTASLEGLDELTDEVLDDQKVTHDMEGVLTQQLIYETIPRFDVDEIAYSPQLEYKLGHPDKAKERGVFVKSWNRRVSEADLKNHVRGLLEERDRKISRRRDIQAAHHGHVLVDPHLEFINDIYSFIYDVDIDLEEDEVSWPLVEPPVPPKPPTPPPLTPHQKFIEEVLMVLNSQVPRKEVTVDEQKPKETSKFLKGVKTLLNEEGFSGQTKSFPFTRERVEEHDDVAFVKKMKGLINESEDQNKVPQSDHKEFLRECLVLINDEPVTEEIVYRPLQEIESEEEGEENDDEKTKETNLSDIASKPSPQLRQRKEIGSIQIYGSSENNTSSLIADVTEDGYKVYVRAAGQQIQLADHELEVAKVVLIDSLNCESELARIIISLNK